MRAIMAHKIMASWLGGRALVVADGAQIRQMRRQVRRRFHSSGRAASR